MPVRPLTFNGANIFRPGYYAKKDIEAGGRVGGVPLGTMIVIAKSEGGIPFGSTDFPEEERLMFFSESSEAKRVLRGGDALEAVLIALNASNDSRINPGASEVAVLRVNPATRSQMNIKNSGANNAILVKSYDYGLHTTGIAVSVSTGTTGKLVQVRKDGETLAQDNITRSVISVQYTGNGTAATITKNATGITTALTGQTDGSQNLSVPFATYDTIQKIVDYIAAQPGYTAEIIDTEFAESLGAELDVVSAVDIKSAALPLKADVQAVIDYLNTTGIVVASVADEAQRTNVANTTSFEYLTGGVEGTTTNTEWSNALDFSLNFDADFVGVMTGSASVHAMLQAHVNFANQTKTRRDRRGFTGCDLSDVTDSAIQAKSKSIGSQFVGFYGGNDYRFDSKGVLRQLPGYLLSAGIAGMSAGNDPTTPLTHKQFNIVKTAKTYSTPQVEAYIKAGCMISTPIEGGGGFKIERSVTTYFGANIIANEWSAMGTVIAIIKTHRARLQERFIGVAGTALAQSLLESYSLEVLEQLLARGWFTENRANGEVAITNHVVKVTGDVYEISYDGIVTLPINYIPATHRFSVLGAR